MKYQPDEQFRKHLNSQGIRGKRFTINSDSHAEVFEQFRRWHPEESEEQLHDRAAYFLLWKHRKNHNAKWWLKRLALAGGILLALFFCSRAEAQVDCVKWQASDSSTVGNFCAPFKVKAGTNVTFSRSGTTLTISTSAAADANKPFYDMVRDCGLAGDGVTDDSAAANACFAAHPGYEFFFPKTQANGTCSYKFNSTLTPTGAGVIIRGDGGGGSYISTTHLGGTELCFNGVTGIMLDNVGHSATVQDISLNGLAGTQLQSAPNLVNLPPVSPLYSRNISSIQRSTQVLTVTVSVLGAEGLSAQVGSILQIAGVTGDATMNGTCVVASVSNTSTNPLTFTCSQNGADSGPFGAVGTVLPYTTGTSTADGIRVCGNFHTIRHVGIGFFGRHGINAASNETGCVAAFSDDLVVRDSVISNNQGFNIFMRGVDSNAGLMDGNSLYYAGLWGAYDSSFLGNNWVANQASYNGLSNASLSTPATKVISAISRTSGTVSVTLASADTNIKVGSAVVIAGVTDSSFNTTATSAFFVTVLTDSTHYQYLQPGAPVDASSSGGTSRMAKFQEAVLASGLDNGSYKIGPSSSVWNQSFIANYSEGGQNCKFGQSVPVMWGSNMISCVTDPTDWNGIYLVSSTPGLLGSSTNIKAFTNQKDANAALFFEGGVSGGTTRSFLFRWWNNNLNSDSWGLSVDPTGASGTTGSWILCRGTAGCADHRRLSFFGDANANGITRLNSESTGAVQINADANAGTGGFAVYSGGVSPSSVSTIDSAGKGTFTALADTTYADVTEISAPSNPGAGVDRFYADSTAHTLKCLTSSGASCFVAATAAALAANGGNCAGGVIFALGVDASGVGECGTIQNATASVAGVVSTTSQTFAGQKTVTQDNITTTPTDGVVVQNSTLSTAGATLQYSPTVHWTAHVWNTTATAADNAAEMHAYIIPVSGASPSFKLAFRKSLNGGAFSDVMTISDTSNITATTFTGAFAGNASTATALAADGANCSGNNFALGVDAAGAGQCAQPAFSNLSGSATAAQLPNPSATTLGGIESLASVASKWINTISTSGVPSATQPGFADISGSVAASQMPALTGDCTTSAGAVAVTCTQINGANFTVNTSGLPTKVDGITTAGQGVAVVQCITSAKSETGADAAVLSCTPASAVGAYEVCVSIAVSAANTATLGWTMTWTDSKAHANAPTNMHLFQMGVAAPALTFTAAASNDYYACVPINVSNAGTAIVVKTTFSGTSIAYNISATVVRTI